MIVFHNPYLTYLEASRGFSNPLIARLLMYIRKERSAIRNDLLELNINGAGKSSWTKQKAEVCTTRLSTEMTFARCIRCQAAQSCQTWADSRQWRWARPRPAFCRQIILEGGLYCLNRTDVRSDSN